MTTESFRKDVAKKLPAAQVSRMEDLKRAVRLGQAYLRFEVLVLELRFFWV